MLFCVFPGHTYDSLSESGLGPLSRFGIEEVEVMRTSVAAATSAALKSKKRKKSPDGRWQHL